jgi:glyoxylase-like metal-dependent hydrolase (beta-lactamase superfamily II)
MAIRRIHHLNCGSLCPRAPASALGQTGKATMVCHCLLLETDNDGLILVDSGFGRRDAEERKRVPALFRALVRPALAMAETAYAQVVALGFAASDVRHIVITHLDLDHAGGIIDFPDATVHVHRFEHRAAMDRATRAERSRYIPAQWAHAPKWSLYETQGDSWRGLPSIAKLKGVNSDIGLLPMFGHTRGHSAVTVNVNDGYLIHAGDAYFHRNTIVGGDVPWGVRFFEKKMQTDKAARLASVAALAATIANHSDVKIFCSHDPAEYSASAQSKVH